MRRREAAPPLPGQVLKTLLPRTGLTQEQLAKRIRVSRITFNKLLNGRMSLTVAMALRLSKVLGTSVEFWLNLQRSVDVYREREKMRDTLASLRPVKRASVRAISIGAVLKEQVKYLERLKHRAKVRGGPDVSAMGIADEAIGQVQELLRALQPALTK